MAKDKYHLEPCEEKREIVATKKELLKTCYTEVEEEILVSKIRRVEETADRCKNKESWNLVNNITGRTGSGCGLIEGVAQQNVWRTGESTSLGYLVSHLMFLTVKFPSGPYILHLT